MKLIILLAGLLSVNAYAKDECASKSITAAKALAKINSPLLSIGALAKVLSPEMGEGGSLIYKVKLKNTQFSHIYIVETVQSEGPCQVLSVSTNAE